MGNEEYPGYDPDGENDCPCSSPGYPHSPEFHNPN